jgi:hypothetical protein
MNTLAFFTTLIVGFAAGAGSAMFYLHWCVTHIPKEPLCLVGASPYSSASS